MTTAARNLSVCLTATQLIQVMLKCVGFVQARHPSGHPNNNLKAATTETTSDSQHDSTATRSLTMSQ